MKRNESKHTSAEEAQRNILRHLNVHARDARRALNKAALGYAAYPDYNFKAPQGAAFSVAKIVHAMEKEKWVQYHGSDWGRGFTITPAGQRRLQDLEATLPQPAAAVAETACKQHRTPCRECPWRTTSAKGWLGASTPLQFLAQAEAEIKMPCHCAVDYEREDWEAQAAQAPRCAGHAIYLRNRCKLPQEPGLAAFVAAVEPDREKVFSRPDAFVEHHGGDVTRVPAVLLGLDTGD
jgi:hypothetical protein